jgi:hypothetical protein
MARDFIISHGVAGMDGMHPLRLPPEHSGPRAFLPLSWKRIRASRASLFRTGECFPSMA